MKLLLDTCVWGGAKSELLGEGHEVVWVGDWDVDPGDEEILARAHAEARILVTLDKDFGELAVVRGRLIRVSSAWSASAHGDKLRCAV